MNKLTSSARFGWIVAILLILVAGPLQGAQVYFDNGDRLTGSLTEITTESVTMDLAIDQTVTVDRSRVRAFSTREPVTVRFQDQHYITGQVVRVDTDVMQLHRNYDPIGSPFKMQQINRVFIEDPRQVLREELEVKLDGYVNAGFNDQSGNTNQASYHFESQLRARTPENRYTLRLEYNEEETNDVTTEENALAFAKYDHFLSQRWFLFTSSLLQQETFSNIDLRSVFSAGTGYQFYETEDRLLSVETGLSYTNESFVDSTPSENYFGLRYAIDYEEQLITAARFFHFQEGIAGTGDEGDFTFRSRTGFRFPLGNGFQSVLQYNLEWDQEPTPGNESTDREIIFSLGYTF